MAFNKFLARRKPSCVQQESRIGYRAIWNPDSFIAIKAKRPGILEDSGPL